MSDDIDIRDIIRDTAMTIEVVQKPGHDFVMLPIEHAIKLLNIARQCHSDPTEYDGDPVFTTLAQLDPTDLRRFLGAVLGLLYFDPTTLRWDYGREWEADTIEHVATALPGSIRDAIIMATGATLGGHTGPEGENPPQPPAQPLRALEGRTGPANDVREDLHSDITEIRPGRGDNGNH